VGRKREPGTLLSLPLIHSSTLRIPQETQAEEISNKFSNLKKEEKNRAKKIQDVEKTIQTLQADLEKPVEVENMTDVDDEIVRLFTSYICIFPTLE
jgi:hypothetical protein